MTIASDISPTASLQNIPVILITILEPPPILLFGIIFQEEEGVNISGHSSPTRYEAPQDTGHHDARAPLIIADAVT